MKHETLASGQWFTLSLLEQLGNIGSEVSRARRWQTKNEKLFAGAVDRALELFDLTLRDPRRRHRLKEIARARELFCDAALGLNTYQTSLADLDRYFTQFAMAARNAGAA